MVRALMATDRITDADQRLTEEEAEQYDRQIRLWGLEAQKRCVIPDYLARYKIRLLMISSLRASRVLMVGMRGLAAEICKNVVLAGVKSLTVMDHRPLIEEDCATRFLCFKLGENVRDSVIRSHYFQWIYLVDFVISFFLRRGITIVHVCFTVFRELRPQFLGYRFSTPMSLWWQIQTMSRINLMSFSDNST